MTTKDKIKAIGLWQVNELFKEPLTEQEIEKLNNEKKQSFEFQYLLSKGNYIIEVSRNKTTLKTFKMIVK